MNSILLLFMIIIIFFIVISLKCSYDVIRLINVIICIILSLIAYRILPSPSLDLYRYYSHIQAAQYYGLDFIFNHPDYNSLPVAALYVSLFAILKNKFLLPSMTCFIYYFFITNLVITYSKQRGKDRIGLTLSLILIYTVSNYLGVVSGIRNSLAISVFIYILYKDLLFHSRFLYCFIGYILLSFFHPSILILLFLRIILFINEKFDCIICLLLLIWTFGKVRLFSIISLFSSNYLSFISTKASSYDVKEANSVANVPLYTFIYFLFYVFSLVVLLFYIKTTIKRIEKKQSIIRYFYFLLSFCFGAIFEYHVFVRSSRAILLLLPVLVINLISNEELGKRSKFFILLIVLLVSIFFISFYTYGQYNVLNFY